MRDDIRVRYDDKKEAISFRASIPAGQRKEYKERVKRDGTVEGIFVKFYQGQQLGLQVQPFIKRRGSNALQPLITYPSGADQFLSGDDDYFAFDITQPVNNDDEIFVVAKNTSGFTCNLVCDIIVDYCGGKDRVL